MINVDDPAACEPCHKAIVDEWRESMHSRAHHAADPIYAGIRRIRMRKEGNQIAEACAGCHTPRAPRGQHEGAVAKAGVTCSTCHHVAEVLAGHAGRAALRRPKDATLLLGPHDIPAKQRDKATHGVGRAPKHMKQPNQLCLACHQELRSPAGIAICTTGPEALRVPKANPRGCVGCHMPKRRGPGTKLGKRQTHASHAFIGPHRAWYQGDLEPLRAAVTITGKWTEAGLAVEVINKSGHAFPTGFPGRVAMLRIVGLDDQGKPVWRSKQTRRTTWRKIYLDAKGKPTLAPYAARLASDTRIPAGKRFAHTFPLPATVSSARIEVGMRLLPAKLAKRLELVGRPEARPIWFAKKQVARPRP